MDRIVTQPPKRHSLAALGAFSIFLAFLIAAFIALGIWQVHRLAWKEDLIARVDARVHADPVQAPGRIDWAGISADKDEYRRVTMTGTFDHNRETLVFASTTLGAGYWVVTPLDIDGGTSILVNRGFVPSDRRDPASRREGNTAGPVTVTGLLRVTEPKGTLIKANVPDEDRWYSRDVAAIAEKRGVKDAAPYFIDADASPNPGGYPVGGLTVISFPNSHLVYAITWFAMAIMASGMLVFVIYSELKARRWYRLQTSRRL